MSKIVNATHRYEQLNMMLELIKGIQQQFEVTAKQKTGRIIAMSVMNSFYSTTLKEEPVLYVAMLRGGGDRELADIENFCNDCKLQIHAETITGKCISEWEMDILNAVIKCYADMDCVPWSEAKKEMIDASGVNNHEDEYAWKRLNGIYYPAFKMTYNAEPSTDRDGDECYQIQLCLEPINGGDGTLVDTLEFYNESDFESAKEMLQNLNFTEI